jgi:hypothetical protein
MWEASFLVLQIIGLLGSMKLRVFASLVDDMNHGWTWVPEKVMRERAVVKIKNVDAGKSVFCEVLPIGENYLHRYNANNRTHQIIDANSTIVVSEWYRRKLGVDNTFDTVDFEISICENAYGHLRACFHHPQIVVRLATELGVISASLGLLSVIMAIL